jgi:hypothetical protein
LGSTLRVAIAAIKQSAKPEALLNAAKFAAFSVPAQKATTKSIRPLDLQHHRCFYLRLPVAAEPVDELNCHRCEPSLITPKRLAFHIAAIYQRR